MVNKQEEIREGLFMVLFPHAPSDRAGGDETVGKVLKYLHSKDVAIKVEGGTEPPVAWTMPSAVTPSQARVVVKAFRKAYTGYVATEPLIKE